MHKTHLGSQSIPSIRNLLSFRTFVTLKRKWPWFSTLPWDVGMFSRPSYAALRQDVLRVLQRQQIREAQRHRQRNLATLLALVREPREAEGRGSGILQSNGHQMPNGYRFTIDFGRTVLFRSLLGFG